MAADSVIGLQESAIRNVQEVYFKNKDSHCIENLISYSLK
jgi:hypothetical protein